MSAPNPHFELGDERLPARFWAKVQPSPGPLATPCWVWAASTTPKGYGSIRVARVLYRAHRFAYEALVEPVRDGLMLDHLCRSRACVNPGHLEPVTNRENQLRGDGPSGRNARKTACVHGHPFTPENTYVPPRRPGTRYCLTCRDARNAARSR